VTTLYVHKTCFDGVASGALASLFMERFFGKSVEAVVAVDYDIKGRWKEQVQPGSCIVDFLYHPHAAFWWDHHANPFMEKAWETSYRQKAGPAIQWNPRAPSCARLVSDQATSVGICLPDFLQETVQWADKIDRARYKSPLEAVSTREPARRLALSLATDRTTDYHSTLIRLLCITSMEQVVLRPECQNQCRIGVQRYEKGLKIMESSAKLDHDVVMYSLNLDDEIIDRMMPYYLFPEANFSLGIVRQRGQLKVTCNSNPWIVPRGVHVGDLFSNVGGGGHRDVGSVIVLDGEQKQAERILEAARIQLLESVTAA
jgi:hypothetical protein